jgi:putative transposase
MSNYRRDQTLGGTWFFTLVAFKRRRFFCREVFRNALRRSILKARKSHPFVIDAWVLLPDHIHCIWTLPEGDANFSLRWKLIKQFVTGDCAADFSNTAEQTVAKKKRRESTIWQRRFWEHSIRDQKDFANHLNYLHFNPVKHGYCLSAADWRYSSFHRYQALGVYPKNWGTVNQNTHDDTNYGE